MKWLAVLLALLVAAPAAAATPPRGLEDEVVYHIFTRSMRDTNGDGHGDLKGIAASLDYLDKLRVTAILLTPLYPSHLYHNYFASDFEGIDPEYGTMDDFRALVAAVHARGMKIYLDMEFQYLAEDHEWWAAAHRDPKSPYADWMLWDERARGIAEEGPFGLRAIPNWSGRTVGVTTVDLKAVPVKAYFDKYLLDWVDPNRDGKFDDGVDGFRLDHMMDDLDDKGLLTNLFAEFWKPAFDKLRAVNPALTFIAEQPDWDIRKSYGEDHLSRGDTSAVFAFPIYQAIRKFDKAELVEAITDTARLTPPGKHQLMFAENHDVGRVASDAGMTPERLRTAAALAILLKGTPILYYGQELGMRGLLDPGYKTDESAIAVREAFEWEATAASPVHALWYRRPGQHYWDARFAKDNDGVSVAEQAGDPASLLERYRRLLALRREHGALRGDQRILDSASGVLAVERSSGRERLVIVANLTAAPVRWTGAGTGRDLIGGGGKTLRPWQTALFRAR